MRTAPLLSALSLAAAATLTAAPAGAAAPQQEGRDCPQLSRELAWHGDNREQLQQAIDEAGSCSGGHRARPVAAFDWDNTITKNDVTDAVIAWSLRHDKILRPERWSDTSKWLTPAAEKALTEACGTEVPVGEPLPTSTDTDCADEIFEIRAEAKTMAGDEAFEGTWNHRRTVPEYAWVPQLFVGHTVAELRSYAAKSRAEALAAPVGAKQTVGTHEIPAYVRYYDQQRDLLKTLKKAGFDVYIVSAGSEPVTEVWSKGVGIDRKHTIAIRSVLKDGRITPYNYGCGDVGVTEGEYIPYIDGKRCAVNQEIFGVQGADAWKKQGEKHRIAIGGGDADTDVTFVGDATAAHLVLNRNKPEIMCRGYDDADGKWVVNPMFIEPLPQQQAPYPCATSAYANEDGTHGPVLRENGDVVPDQEDKAY
ncbi:haloacid dehalogenase-like hydrolase [Streptomyces sp. A7024]|uniref:phosphoserine phosphatase n=1 Tax=Streptomyces coryli TaxID=1128680 RepID=A0A6G4TWZ9_9ACTN|nr:haloacid dehalogenase-like hydrolase [Streptomyces coryli]NGN64302.1 haloacid dehalogenase-like hydrolase [Streptomyces coryli]